LWDTYRAAHPLYTLLNPDRVDDFVNTMLGIYDQQGLLPVWHLNGYETGTMTGISSMQVIAEAYLKGFRGFDVERAYQAIKATAMSDSRGLNFVKEFKPIPSDARVGSPVARALEYAISDGSTALMAKAMGKTEDYEYFTKRAGSYKLYYDPEKGFFRGKMTDGSWNPNFDPVKSTRPWSTDWAEGNSWQYLWLVPQDVKGLMALLGGEKTFISRLDTFFSLKPENTAEVLVDLTGVIGQYAHGNEPGHHIAYLYNYAGQQWKTAEKVRYIMKEFYHDRPDGVIGNEDCGQMSAWYVFSALGFYPVFPASGVYVIGSPIFDKATINLGNGKKFTIETINNGPDKLYIQSIELNGKNYTSSFIRHQDILNGGTMRIKMGDKPNFNFGTPQTDRP
jgi:predicted alpha-1,2-mannosidase